MANEIWQIVIFTVSDKPNHCGISLPNGHLADLSLLGARIIPWSGPSLPKGDRTFFDINVPYPETAIKFLSQPGELARPIIVQEKKQRGWHLSEEAPDFVRTFHQKRSLNPEEMNCVEWIVRALELGGVQGFDDQVLTPTELLNWCKPRLIQGKV